VFVETRNENGELVESVDNEVNNLQSLCNEIFGEEINLRFFTGDADNALTVETKTMSLLTMNI
jgi:hypothetical protein